MSDNGGSGRIVGRTMGLNYGSNWPLRQGKGSFFEGGIRTPAFIWAPALLKRRGGLLTNQLFHVVDWLPTLYEAVGGNITDLGVIDGVSQWRSLVEGRRTGPRTELPYIQNQGSTTPVVIYQEPESGVLYKLLGGSVGTASYTGW